MHIALRAWGNRLSKILVYIYSRYLTDDKVGRILLLDQHVENYVILMHDAMLIVNLLPSFLRSLLYPMSG
jgi:hypothetical protein